MMAPKRVRIAYSVSFTENSENATNSNRPATTKNQGKSRELISALPPRTRALDGHLVGRVLATARALRARLLLAVDAFLEELVDREIHEVVAGVAVDDHLVRPRQHRLDRIHVEPPAGDFRRLRIGAFELREARRLALRDRRHLRLVGLRILLHARGRALRGRQQAVGVS